MATKPKTTAKPAAKSAIGGAEIYTLSDPRDGAIRYIGKARNAVARLKAHLCEMRRNTPLYRWIAKLRREGVTPAMAVVCVAITDNWQDLERAIISQGRTDGLRLLNVAEGGDEPFCPREVRAENGRKNAAARESDPIKRFIWAAKQRLGVFLKDKHISEEAKERMRVKMRLCAAKRPDLFGSWATV